MKRAVFRCRAGANIGGGHVVRCLALANKLAALGWHCSFAVNKEASATVGSLTSASLGIHDLDDFDDTDLLVIDDYDADAATESRLRDRAGQIMCIDDLADRPHQCDVLLDPTLGRTGDDYQALVQAPCRMLLGPDYALVRAEFAERRRQALARDIGEIRRVLVAPGQVDQADLAGLAVAAVRQAVPDAAVDVVLGRSAPHRQRMADLSDSNVTLHVDLDGAGVADLMTRADLAIGAGGGGTWERCVLGLPTIVVVVADNQAAIAMSLERAGAAVVAGRMDDVDATSLGRLIAGLAGRPQELRQIAERAATLCDGRGVFRTAVAIIPHLVAANDHHVRLRAAELDDCAAMYAWQQDPETRRYARNTDVPTWSEHQSWLRGKLDDDNCLFTVIERDQEAAGVLRLDRRDDSFEVSIVVAPEHRGAGVGAAALRLGRDLVPGHALTAFVKPQNKASERLFRQAGYEAGVDGLYRQLPEAA